MANLAFDIVANMVNNVGPAANQIRDNMRGLRTQFSDTNTKLFDLNKATSSVGQGLSKISGGFINAGSATSTLNTAFKGLTPSMVGAVGTFALAAVGAVKAAQAFGRLTAETAEYADMVDKASQRMGLSAQRFQELDFLLQRAGTSMSQMESGFKDLQKKALEASKGTGEAAKAFKALDIRTTDVNGELKASGELFDESVEKLRGVENATLRTAYAQQIFGESGVQLAAYLNTSSRELDAQKQRLELLGGVMSGELIKDGARLNDSLSDVGKAFTRIGQNIVEDAMQPIADSLEALIDSGFLEYANDLADVVGKVLYGAFWLLEKIVQSLALAFTLVRTGLESIIQGLLELIGLIPDKLLPEGWAEGIDLVKQTNAEDLEKRMEQITKLGKDLAEIKGPDLSVDDDDGQGGSVLSDKKDLQEINKEWSKLMSFMVQYKRDADDIRKEIDLILEKPPATNYVKSFREVRDEFKVLEDNIVNIFSEKGEVNDVLQEAGDKFRATFNEVLKMVGAEARVTGEQIEQLKKRVLDAAGVDESTRSGVINVDGVEKNLRQVLKEVEDAFLIKIGAVYDLYQARAIQAEENIKEETKKRLIETSKAYEYEYDRKVALVNFEYQKRLEALRLQYGDVEHFTQLSLALEEQRQLELQNLRNEQAEEDFNAYQEQLQRTLELKEEYVDLELQLEIENSQNITEEYNHRFEALKIEKERELALVKDNADARAEIEKIYTLKAKKLNQEKTKDIKEENEALVKKTVSAVSSISSSWASYFSDRAEMERGSYDESTAASKKYGNMYKAAAMAQTAIDTASAAMAAYRSLAGIAYVGPVLGAAAAATVIAAGGVQMGKIASQQFKDGGFPRGANAIVQVNEDGQEAILNARATRALGKDNIDQLNAGGSIGQTVTVAPSIVIQGNADMGVVDRISDELTGFARKVEAVFERRLIDTSRVSSALAF